MPILRKIESVSDTSNYTPSEGNVTTFLCEEDGVIKHKYKNKDNEVFDINGIRTITLVKPPGCVHLVLKISGINDSIDLTIPSITDCSNTSPYIIDTRCADDRTLVSGFKYVYDPDSPSGSKITLEQCPEDGFNSAGFDDTTIIVNLGKAVTHGLSLPIVIYYTWLDQTGNADTFRFMHYPSYAEARVQFPTPLPSETSVLKCANGIMAWHPDPSVIPELTTERTFLQSENNSLTWGDPLPPRTSDVTFLISSQGSVSFKQVPIIPTVPSNRATYFLIGSASNLSFVSLPILPSLKSSGRYVLESYNGVLRWAEVSSCQS